MSHKIYYLKFTFVLTDCVAYIKYRLYGGGPLHMMLGIRFVFIGLVFGIPLTGGKATFGVQSPPTSYQTLLSNHRCAEILHTLGAETPPSETHNKRARSARTVHSLQQSAPLESIAPTSDVVHRGIQTIQNSLYLLFGDHRTRKLDPNAQDSLAYLRNPSVALMVEGEGVDIPVVVFDRRKRDQEAITHEIWRLSKRKEEGIRQLEGKFVEPWMEQVINAYVEMDQRRAILQPTGAIFEVLTDLKLRASELYRDIQTSQLNLGNSQDRILSVVQHLLFELVAASVGEGSPLNANAIRKGDIASQESLFAHCRTGALRPELCGLFLGEEEALLSAFTELYAKILTPHKTGLSISSRLTLKAFCQALISAQEILDVENPLPGLSKKLIAALKPEQDELELKVTRNGVLSRSIKGVHLRTRLESHFLSLLLPLAESDQLRSLLFEYAEQLAESLDELREEEKRDNILQREYANQYQAARVAGFAIDRIARPYGALGMTPDSIRLQTKITHLPEELREVAFLLIELQGSYYDFRVGKRYYLQQGLDAHSQLDALPPVTREQILARQFYSPDRVDAIAQLAQVHYLRFINDELKSQLGARQWKQVANIADTMRAASMQRGLSELAAVLGGSKRMMGQLIEVIIAKADEKSPIDNKHSALTTRFVAPPLPPADKLKPHILAIWDTRILGPRPKTPRKKDQLPPESSPLPPSLTASDPPPVLYEKASAIPDGVRYQLAVPPLDDIRAAALSDSFTLLTSVLKRLEAVSIRIFSTPGRITHEMNEQLASAVRGGTGHPSQTELWSEYNERLHREYTLPSQAVRQLFGNLILAMRSAYRAHLADESTIAQYDQGKEERMLLAQNLADVALIEAVTPHEALCTLLFMSEGSIYQPWYAELATFIGRQGHNADRAQILTQIPEETQHRRDFIRKSLIGVGIATGGVILSEGIRRFVFSTGTEDSTED